ncbi:MAG: PIN domain-containing protein [Armatimonadota bacterium]
MRRIWSDTSFWYAFLYRDEPVHADAVALIRDLEAEIITSTFAIAETASLVTKRGTKVHAIALYRYLDEAGECNIVHPSQGQFEAARDLFLSHPDWDFDLVDAISFTLMRDLEIDTALTLDSHFAQMGFETMPG